MHEMNVEGERATMKIIKEKLEWDNKCCGCLSAIPANHTTFILTDIAGMRSSIHFCKHCIEKIAKEYESEVEQ